MMLIDCKNKNSQYINRTNVVEAYLKDIRQYKVLSSNEQRELLYKVRNGSEQERQMAINKLVETNQRFVVSFAKKWSCGDNLLDLINEANLGLIEAIKKFDIDSKNNFLTYAVWWIRKYVNEYRNVYDDIVKRPNAHRYKLYVPKARKLFIDRNQREPTLEELKDVLKDEFGFNVTTLTDIEGVQTYMLDYRSDEENINKCSEAELLFNKCTSTNNINEDINEGYTTDFVKFLMSKLSEKERFVITKTFGIGCEEESVEKIADELGIPDNKVKLIIKKTRKKLQRYENFN